MTTAVQQTYFTLQCIIVQGISCWGEKCTKQTADLKYFHLQSNHWMDSLKKKKSSFQGEATFFLLKHPKLASTGIPNLLQSMLVFKTLHHSPIQYKAEVSLEEQEKSQRTWTNK